MKSRSISHRAVADPGRNQFESFRRSSSSSISSSRARFSKHAHARAAYVGFGQMKREAVGPKARRKQRRGRPKERVGARSVVRRDKIRAPTERLRSVRATPRCRGVRRAADRWEDEEGVELPARRNSAKRRRRSCFPKSGSIRRSFPILLARPRKRPDSLLITNTLSATRRRNPEKILAHGLRQGCAVPRRKMRRQTLLRFAKFFHGNQDRLHAAAPAFCFAANCKFSAPEAPCLRSYA